MITVLTSPDARASTHVSNDELRAAIYWALEHDVACLALHREVVHTAVDGSARRRADEALVARYRMATAR